MFSHSHFSLKVTLALVLILYTMVKSRCFCQPDGISQTLSVPDLVTIENFIITSLFTTSPHKRYQFHRQKSIIYLLLLLCGDIETYPGPAGFFTEINNFCRTKGLKLFHLNIRGLQGNFNKIRDVLLNTKIDIFGLTEIFLESNSLMGFDVPGYSFIQRDQVSGTRGGVGMECTFKMVSTTSQGETRFG